MIVCHGETIVEPVAPGTNLAALDADIDILSHPGLLSDAEAELAVRRGICLELSARKGHCLCNGHVARLALKHGAKLVINSDAHSPGDLIPLDFAKSLALGAGLSVSQFEDCLANSAELVQNAQNRK